MVNCVLHDSFEHVFVRISASRSLLPQVFLGKTPDSLFQQVAALLPAGDQFAPWNRWFRPLLLRLPARHWMALRSATNSFVPKQQVLQQLRNGVRAAERRLDRRFRRNLVQELGD